MSSEQNLITRKFNFTTAAFFVYANTCCLRNLKIKVPKELLRSKTIKNPYVLCINGVDVAPSDRTNNYLVWNFETIRNNFREIIPLTQEENDLVCLEETLAYNSLLAQKFYPIELKELMNCVFTSELQIGLKPNFKDFPTSIEAEEVVYKR